VLVVREYLDEEGRSPFARWFSKLAAAGVARVSAVIDRMEKGNLGDYKSVGQGVLERRIDFGPGYRIYFGLEGEQLVLLLGGGTKKRQAHDIARAQQRWIRHRRLRREG